MPALPQKIKRTAMLLPQPVVRGRLIARYKRFFADVELDSGETITAHCANTGSMLGLKEPGQTVWVSKAANPKRTLGWDLQMVELPTGLVGINTGHPNRIVGEAIAEKAIALLAHYCVCKPEVKYGESSRIDFLLTGEGLPDCYVEVKNVHFSQSVGLAEFPDSRTARGVKHLAEMANMVRQGKRAVMIYLVQRDDCTRMGLCADLDPAYAHAFDLAKLAGVEALAYSCRLSTSEIRLGQALPISPAKDYF